MKVVYPEEQSTLRECQRYFSKNLLLNKLPGYCWIAGGALRSYLSGDETKDIDIYTNRPEYFERNLAYLIANNWTRIYENENSVVFNKNGVSLDLIKRTFSSPEKCINEFDFTICCAAFNNTFIFHHNDFEQDVTDRVIRFNKPPSDTSSLYKRIIKYQKMGYRYVESFGFSPSVIESAHYCNHGLSSGLGTGIEVF